VTRDNVVLDLVSWPARVTGTSEVRENDTGNLKGFLVTLSYQAFGETKALTFCMDTEAEARQFLIGNEITICLEART